MIAVVVEALTYLLYLSPLGALGWAMERVDRDREEAGRR